MFGLQSENPKINPPKITIVRDKRDKFQGFEVQLGAVKEKVPLRYLLVSEIKKLEDLLRRAYDVGRESMSGHTGSVQQAREGTKEAGSSTGSQVHDSDPGSDLSSLDEGSSSSIGPAA